MAFLQVERCKNEIVLNTPNRNEILKAGPPQNSIYNILGKGAFGIVLKAVFRGMQVAVKIVNNCRNKNLQSMRSESNVLGWKHRNIVRVLKIETTLNFGIVIMERFAGQCLQAILDSITLPLVHRIFVSMDILAALAFCHRRHLLHLDVKPKNVMVAFRNMRLQHFHNDDTCNRNYVCKLCDFGSSFYMVEQRENFIRGATKGTVRYMSPEALREETLTFAADIYSLGITMWQLQHRQLPYYWIKSNEVVAYQVVKCNMRPDSDVACLKPKKLKAGHCNCLCKQLSSEISYRSLENIKSLLKSTENHVLESYPQVFSWQRPNAPSCRKKLHFPFRQLNQEVNSNESQRLSKQEIHSNPCVDLLQRRGLGNNDWLKSLFKDSINSTNKIREERLFESVYKSCWRCDAHRRPGAVELRRSLGKLL